ncbi:GNVR domain-containing protein, partial [Pseudomonas aeruginosa]|uniref:GNVR domain-containing protein n=1 Tax=Pseudomonas aeruginosa TaxID=287 RepID=UPI002B48A72F
NPRNRGGSTGHVLAKRSVTFTEIRTLRASDLKIELVRVDQKAATPLRPIKPRKALVVALGLLGGLALGVLVALVRAMLRAPRQRVQEDSLPPGVVSLDRSLSGT